METYILHEAIGSGRFGTVHRATHETFGIDRAVKLLDARYTDAASVGEAVQRAAVEAREISPQYAVQVYDSGQADGQVWFASELMPLGALSTALAAERAFSTVEVRRICGDVAAALTAAHGLGIVHGNVEPSRVFLADAGGAKLSDFGITATLAAEVGVDTSSDPTRYQPPEQGSGDAARASDLYALGKIALEMFGADAAALPMVEETDPELWELLQRMLDEDPGQRPEAIEIRDVLLRSAGTPPPEPISHVEREEPEPTLIDRLRERAALVAVGGVVVVAALASVVALLAGGGDTSETGSATTNLATGAGGTGVLTAGETDSQPPSDGSNDDGEGGPLGIILDVVRDAVDPDAEPATTSTATPVPPTPTPAPLLPFLTPTPTPTPPPPPTPTATPTPPPTATPTPTATPIVVVTVTGPCPPIDLRAPGVNQPTQQASLILPFTAWGENVCGRDIVTAYIGSEFCRATVADDDGRWFLQIESTDACAPEDGAVLRFELNLQPTAAEAIWRAAEANVNGLVLRGPID